jgi:uncharacterized protein (TIGR00251 family)
MIEIHDHREGCVLLVHAQPGARRNALVGERAGALKVAVTAPPDQGRANNAIVGVLCEQLDLKKSQVELISGATYRDKKFLLRGVARDAVAAQLQNLLGDSGKNVSA